MHVLFGKQNKLNTFTMSVCFSSQGIRDKVIQFASLPGHARAQCCVLCVLSHGENGAIYGTDGKLLPVAELKYHLDARRCPTLKDKPKLIFLEACRGGSTMFAMPPGDFIFPDLLKTLLLKSGINSDIEYSMLLLLCNFNTGVEDSYYDRLGAKTIKKNTNSTQNKSQTHRAKQYEVPSFLSTDCELSTETCSKNVYSLGPRSFLEEPTWPLVIVYAVSYPLFRSARLMQLDLSVCLSVWTLKTIAPTDLLFTQEVWYPWLGPPLRWPGSVIIGENMQSMPCRETCVMNDENRCILAR